MAEGRATQEQLPRWGDQICIAANILRKICNKQVKAIGGIWNAGEKLWYAPEAHVQRIGLENRIVR